LNQHYVRSVLDTNPIPGYIFSPQVGQVIIMGPYKGTRPTDTASRRKILTCHPTAGSDEIVCAKKIIGSLARQFLFDFSDSGIRDVSYILRNFSDRCPDGKANETNDVAFNRQHFIINSSSIGSASVSVDFVGTCPFRLRRADACALVPAEWASTSLDDNSKTRVIGTDQVTAVYDPNRQRWGLCDSDFDGHNATLSSLRGFIR